MGQHDYSGPERRGQEQRVVLADHQIEEIARMAADKATRKTFAILGVDIDKPESIENFRDGLRFVRRLRQAADHGWLVVAAMLAGGAVWALLDGIINAVRSGKH